MDIAEDFKLAQIELELKRAQLYFDAGYKNEAIETLEEARYRAIQEEKVQLLKEIESIIARYK